MEALTDMKSRIYLRLIATMLAMTVGSSTGCEPGQGDESGAAGEGALEGSEHDLRTAIVQTPTGVREVTYEVIEGYAITEGDIILGTEEELASGEKGIGLSERERRWPNREIPIKIGYIGPVMAARVAEAVAHWEANTDIDFVQYVEGVHDDWVEIVEGPKCWSAVGREGDVGEDRGRQELHLTSGATPFNVVGIAINRPSFRTYTWYTDGTFSTGLPSDLNSDYHRLTYSVPQGLSHSSIVGMDMDSRGRVFTWYNNGHYTIGNPEDLDAEQGLTTYSMPAGVTIAGMHFGPADVVVTYYTNFKRTKGAPGSLASVSGLTNFTGGAAHPSWIVDTAYDRDGVVTAWYGVAAHNGLEGHLRVYGNELNLAADHPSANYLLPFDCQLAHAIHELGHTVGLWHEQQRCDRDDFIGVHYENIDEINEGNFHKSCVTEGTEATRDLGPYDFLSVMHYGPFDQSINGLETITRDDHMDLAPNRTQLSLGDIRSVQELYGYSPAKGRVPSDIVGIGIHPNGRVFAWHSNGTRTNGDIDDLDAAQSAATFSLPPGKTANQIVAMDISLGYRYFAWYRDGTVSEGTSSTNLGSSTKNVQYPSGYSATDVVGIAFRNDNRVVYHYDDGMRSIGTEIDADLHNGLESYQTTDSGQPFTSIVDTAGSRSNNNVYAWYSNFRLSAGTGTRDLDTAMKDW